jgi:hypothetical protein
VAGSKPFLFVSHVGEDGPAAMEIVAELERRGIRCWITPRDVRVGRPFDDEIADAIDASRAMLLIFSERCNDNQYIRREVTVAGESQKIIIPFRIEDAWPKRGLRVRLSDLHWIDGFVARERALDELARALPPEDEEERRRREEGCHQAELAEREGEERQRQTDELRRLEEAARRQRAPSSAAQAIDPSMPHVRVIEARSSEPEPAPTENGRSARGGTCEPPVARRDEPSGSLEGSPPAVELSAAVSPADGTPGPTRPITISVPAGDSTSSGAEAEPKTSFVPELAVNKTHKRAEDPIDQATGTVANLRQPNPPRLDQSLPGWVSLIGLAIVLFILYFSRTILQWIDFNFF